MSWYGTKDPLDLHRIVERLDAADSFDRWSHHLNEITPFTLVR